jgi:hypothetical protein
MLKRIVLLVASTLLAALPAAGEVHVNVNVGIPAPVPIIVVEPPLFLVPPSLGFAVAVDADLFHIDNRYYSCRNGIWYVGPRFNGPWTGIRHDRLPRGLRKHKLEKVRAFRDEEHRQYRRDERGYRGHAFRPEHERDNEHGKGHGKNKGNGKGNGKHGNDKHGNDKHGDDRYRDDRYRDDRHGNDRYRNDRHGD